MLKKIARLRRAKRTRMKIRELKMLRLSVYRSSCHIYAQIFNAEGTLTLVAASTLDDQFKENNKNGSNILAAAEVGKMIAVKALEKGDRKSVV